MAVPVIGIAPFWKLAPSAGESTSSVGARTAEIGTLTMYASVCSEFLPVSGSVAEILKSFRPRRSGTTWLHRPMLSAVAWSWWPDESLIVTVPCGIVVPRNVYSVSVSEVSLTAVDGSETEMDGGFAKRRSWIAR